MVTACSAGTACTPSTRAFSEASLPATGTLYSTVTWIELAAGTLAFVAAGLLLGVSRAPPSRLLQGVLIGLVILAAAGPALLAVDQPSAICADASHDGTPLGGSGATLFPSGTPGCAWQFSIGGGAWYAPGGVMGPQASFLGHATEPGGQVSWGPGIGWGLALAGALIGALGSLVGFPGKTAPNLRP